MPNYMKSIFIFIAICLFLKIEPAVAQLVLIEPLTGGLLQNHSEKKKKKKEEAPKKYIAENANQEKEEALYWSIMTSENIKEITNVPDSLNTEFIFYCNYHIKDKTQSNNYYYREKVMELHNTFEDKSGEEEN